MRRTISQEEFVEAYDAYADGLFRYCYLRVYDRERAKDLMQETFARTWEYLAEGGEIQNLRAFLYRAARNLCVNEQVRKKPVSLDAMQEATGFEPAADASPERDAELALLLRRLAGLKPADRDLLTYRYIEGMAVQDIAEILDEAPNTVSVRIRRALDSLKERPQLP